MVTDRDLELEEGYWATRGWLDSRPRTWYAPPSLYGRAMVWRARRDLNPGPPAPKIGTY